jgi:hypothetical protein
MVAKSTTGFLTNAIGCAGFAEDFGCKAFGAISAAR